MKSEWKECTIGDLGEIVGGATPSTKNPENYKNGDVSWITPKDLSSFNGRYIYKGERNITEKGLKSCSAKILPKNTVLFSSRAPIGYVAIAAKELCTNQGFKSVVPNDDTDFMFLYYLLKFNKNNIEHMGSGTTFKEVSGKTMKSIKVCIPADIEEQKRISTLLSSLDDLIENNQKQIKLLEELAQRLYKEWFVDLHFPDYENTPVIDGVPNGWKRERLVDIANVIMGQSPKSKFYNKNKEGLPFHQGVGSYGTRFVLDEIYSTSFTRIAEAGSILFSVRTPVGRLNITKNKIVIGRGLSAINHKNGYQSYLFYLLKERFFRDNLIGNGSIFASISKDELLEQKFIIPDTKLVKKFDDIAKSIDDKINILDSQIIIAQEIRDRLLPKLMNGEIDVSDIKT